MVEEVLDTRERRLRNKNVTKHLVKWKGLPLEEEKWEGTHIIEHTNIHLLRRTCVDFSLRFLMLPYILMQFNLLPNQGFLFGKKDYKAEVSHLMLMV